MRLDGIIFVCGSFKYTTQDLWCNYSGIVWAAKKLGIQVMYNAMNIQNYNEKDYKCRKLKKYANSECVKMITTRDGIPGVEKLKKYYITNPNIKLLPVGDPAFWMKECYGIHRKPSDVIGINVIRKEVFVDYGRTTSPQKVKQFYFDLFDELDKRNIKWEVFHNGLDCDYDCACEVLKASGRENLITKMRTPKDDVDLVEIISRYKGIVGARLHACICAYALGVPVVGFEWDEKITHFAKEADISDTFCSEQDFRAEVMVDKLENALCKKINLGLQNNWKKKTHGSIKMFLQEI